MVKIMVVLVVGALASVVLKSAAEDAVAVIVEVVPIVVDVASIVVLLAVLAVLVTS